MGLTLDNLKVEQDAVLTNLVLPSTAVVKSLNGTQVLTNADSSAQLFTGNNTGFSCQMPSALTLPQGHKYELYNTGSTTMNILDGAGGALYTLSQTSTGYMYLVDNTTIAGTWLAWQIISNPSIASGILNYKLTSSTTFSTSSVTDVIITAFTITPQAGTYAIWYNSSVTITTNNTILRSSIYKGGTLIADSTRASQASGGGWNGMASTMTTAQFDGTQACDIRVRSSSGSVSVLDRTILMIRLGN